MSSITWETVSRDAEALSPADQSRLMEHLSRRIREYSAPKKPVGNKEEYDDFAAMAARPFIQRDMRAIQEEFAETESDGLHREQYRRELRKMAADPDIQREIKQMEADFAVANLDGLHSEVHGV